MIGDPVALTIRRNIPRASAKLLMWNVVLRFANPTYIFTWPCQEASTACLLARPNKNVGWVSVA